MKTKFIEGTNRKYSIREDGVVLVNYRNLGDKIFIHNEPRALKENSKGCVSLNQKACSVRKIVIKSFNKFKCSKCGEFEKYHHNDKRRRTSGWKCKKCAKKMKILSNLKWKEKNPKYHAIFQEKRRENNLAEWYVKSVMKIKASVYVPEEIIELKRNQLKLFRELKKQKQNDTN